MDVFIDDSQGASFQMFISSFYLLQSLRNYIFCKRWHFFKIFPKTFRFQRVIYRNAMGFRGFFNKFD